MDFNPWLNKTPAKRPNFSFQIRFLCRFYGATLQSFANNKQYSKYSSPKELHNEQIVLLPQLKIFTQINFSHLLIVG